MPEPKTRPTAPGVSRRQAFAAVGVAGAAAASLPLMAPTPSPSTAEPAPAAPSQGGGYRLSAHVQRYYQTAKV